MRGGGEMGSDGMWAAPEPPRNASRVGVDATDPTLIVKVRTPLTSRSLIELAAVVAMRPKHLVSVEGEWLVLRLPATTGGAT